MTNAIKWVIITLTLAFVAGCSNGPKLYTVSGTVSYQGEPVKEGDIVLHSTDPAEHPYAGKIKDGKFEMQSTAGDKTVAITASRQHPTKTKPGIEPGTTEPVIEWYIPAEYNANTKLTETVSPSGSNFKFELK